MSMRIEDTPSIINKEIRTVRPGQTLTYSNLTAREKRDYLFDQGIRPTAYAKDDLPDVQGGVLQFGEAALKTYEQHSLSQTLTRVSDELDPPKLKLFHTYGSTAKVRFDPGPNIPYTGLFREQASGLGRFSYAGPVSGIGVVPAFGLKLLIDGPSPSENLVVMRMLDSQQSRLPLTRRQHSVFQNPFTNILPSPSLANVVMQVVRDRFETVVEKRKGLHQPPDNLAAVRTNGDREKIVVAPYRLIFAPTQVARAASNPEIDFRDDLVQNIPARTVIYDVFALDIDEENQFNASGETIVEVLLTHGRKIGTISTESEFIASAYGDYRLFFKHNADFIRKEFRAAAGSASS
jgi:hypothetical protein